MPTIKIAFSLTSDRLQRSPKPYNLKKTFVTHLYFTYSNDAVIGQRRPSLAHAQVDMNLFNPHIPRKPISHLISSVLHKVLGISICHGHLTARLACERHSYFDICNRQTHSVPIHINQTETDTIPPHGKKL